MRAGSQLQAAWLERQLQAGGGVGRPLVCKGHATAAGGGAMTEAGIWLAEEAQLQVLALEL